MSGKLNKPDNSDRQFVSYGREVKNNGASHEQFTLKSSQTQPFDPDRMSGRPTSNKDKHGSDSVSGSGEK